MSALRSVVVAAAIMVLGVPMASAGERADCSLVEIRASKDGSGVDKALKSLEKQLKTPPFTVWTRFEFKGQHNLAVERLKPKKLKLNIGGEASLTFRDVVEAKGKKKQLRFEAIFHLKDRKPIVMKHLADSGSNMLLMPGGGKTAFIFGLRCVVK